jgi:hypothetical protein
LQLRELLGPGVSQPRVLLHGFWPENVPLLFFYPSRGSTACPSWSAQGPVQSRSFRSGLSGFRVFSLSFPSRTVLLHEAIPVHVPLRYTSRVGRCYTGEIDASMDRLFKSMIRARGLLPASHTNERWAKCCAFPCSSRKSLPAWRIIVLISVCWNLGVHCADATTGRYYGSRIHLAVQGTRDRPTESYAFIAGCSHRTHTFRTQREYIYAQLPRIPSSETWHCPVYPVSFKL